MVKYRFFFRSDGECRTLYKGPGRTVYCLMEAGDRSQSCVAWYRCGNDGYYYEPSHTEPMPALDAFDKIEMPSNPWRIEPKLIGEGLRPAH